MPSLVSSFRDDFLAFDATTDQSEWPCPKMVDFDEGAGVFVLDERQNHKTPDWTYDA